ncbi:hypothetical protein [Bradymonas sediminis]|uniref:Uncharacterized protein n=1 Tax=Bradymonas sediminis TaxID=1548548 RepID=A0A2Z4FPB6_9DELT|nr:hypothetical protein [Bradymonas sediminis]AWV90839.1 hypothetical protein DN745_16540 [Bradymonas sediminis]TDP75425.1 hypothetical protein DFR33_104293 [Bradymonas sediminis]
MQLEPAEPNKFRTPFRVMSGCLGLLTGTSGLVLLGLGSMGRSACGPTVQAGEQMIENDAGSGLEATLGVFTSLFGMAGSGVSWLLLALGSALLLGTLIWAVLAYKAFESR